MSREEAGQMRGSHLGARCVFLDGRRNVRGR